MDYVELPHNRIYFLHCCLRKWKGFLEHSWDVTVSDILLPVLLADSQVGILYTGRGGRRGVYRGDKEVSYENRQHQVHNLQGIEEREVPFPVHPRHRGRLLQYTHKQKNCRCHRRKVDLPQPGHHCHPFKLPVTFPIAVTSPSFTSKKHRISHTEEF